MKQDYNRQSSENGREPPIHIPLNFERAVEGLLGVTPTKKPATTKPKKRRPAKKKAGK